MQTPTQSRMIVKNPIGPSSVLNASRISAVQKIKKLSETPGTVPIVGGNWSFSSMSPMVAKGFQGSKGTSGMGEMSYSQIDHI